MKKFLYIVLSLIAITGLIVALFARVPFDGGASPVAQANQREDLAVELSRDAFGVAPDTLSYSVTNNREVPVGVFRHASIERLAGALFAALGKNGINVRMISQGPEELNIIVGVNNDDFEKTIRVIYDSFVK